MVEIGGKPILWHIMKIYSSYGINDFIICLGYKGYLIKEYFANYFMHMSDFTVDLKNNSIKLNKNNSEPWTITLVDTGDKTMTGGRLKRVYEYIKDDDCFCFTYGDGLADINIKKLISFHLSHNKLATISAAKPPGRFGSINFGEDDMVNQFVEKPEGDGGYINGGFFVLNPKVINFIDDDSISWEHEPLQHLAKINQLKAYKHEFFWQPMDTIREKNLLNNLWNSNNAPWKVW
jgi:glucose-1-phosphate cytidylyltransferase